MIYNFCMEFFFTKITVLIKKIISQFSTLNNSQSYTNSVPYILEVSNFWYKSNKWSICQINTVQNLAPSRIRTGIFEKLKKSQFFSLVSILNTFSFLMFFKMTWSTTSSIWFQVFLVNTWWPLPAKPCLS